MIDKARFAFADSAPRRVPQCFRIVFGPSVEAREHAPDVSIDHRIRLVEGDAENRAGHVLADSGKLEKRFVIGRDLSAMLRSDLPRRRDQIFCAAVVTEASPQLEHSLLIGIRESINGREFTDEPFEIRKGRLDLSLLKHDFRDPHLIGVVRRSPRQRPLIFLKPFDERLEHCLSSRFRFF